MNVDRDKDDDSGGFVGQLVEAGLVEAYVRADGKTAYRLTEEGERVSRILEAAEEETELPANSRSKETSADRVASRSGSSADTSAAPTEGPPGRPR